MDNKDKEMTEEMANCYNCIHEDICQLRTYSYCEEKVKEKGCEQYQPKIAKNNVVLTEEQVMAIIEEEYKKALKDKVVISREEYEEYQSFKNGDYCATECDIHEFAFNQLNRISNLKNEIEKLKNEIKNQNEVLEDRERFRARNEELKKQLAQARKEKAEKLLNEILNFINFETFRQGYELKKIKNKLKEIVTREGFEIKE